MPAWRCWRRKTCSASPARGHQGAADGEENFESLPGERFYKDAAAATRLDMHGDDAIITVEHRGVRLRWKGSGDVIRPQDRLVRYCGREYAGS